MIYDDENQNYIQSDEPFLSSNEKENYNKNWDVQMRLGFIRKVYGVLICQLGFTILICLLPMFIPSFLNFQLNNMFIFILAIILSIASSILLICIPSLSRTVPYNYLLLSLFTLCEAYIISILCGISSKEIVLTAALMTLAVVVGLTIYAFKTKTDFTLLGSLLFIFSAIMLVFGIVIIFTDNNILHLIYSGVGVFLFSIYLVYDTQLIVGNHTLKLGVDDYILGAIMLYTDIISLFVYILDILNRITK